MRGLSAEDLLAVWERGHGKQPVQYALDLYAAARPDESRKSLALHTIGKRDRAILNLREATLGNTLQSVVACPGCGEKLDLIFNTADLQKTEIPPGAAEVSVAVAGYQLRLRVPHSLDVAMALQVPPEVSVGVLFRRCVLSATKDGNTTDEVPAEIMELASGQLSEADPDSEIRLNVSCAFCGQSSSVLFDIATYFWSEIEWWAVRLLGEVHELASAYGWTEREILSLGPARRETYLRAVRT